MKSGTELMPPDEIATAAAAAAGSGALAHLYPRLLLLPQAQGLSLTCIRIACCDRVHARLQIESSRSERSTADQPRLETRFGATRFTRVESLRGHPPKRVNINFHPPWIKYDQSAPLDPCIRLEHNMPRRRTSQSDWP